MAVTKRTQILMEPGELRRLKAEARRRKKSVGALIREAVRETYFRETEQGSADRIAAAKEIFNLNIELPDWPELEEEIESRFDDLPGSGVM